MQHLLEQFLHASRLEKTVLLLFFLFPILNVAVKEGGSAIYVFTLLLSLFLAWPAWKRLGGEERSLILGFVLLFAAAAISLFFSEELYEGWKKLERFFRLMTFGVIYMMLVRLNLKVGHFFLVGVVVSGLYMLGQALYEIYYLGSSVVHGPYYQIAVSAFGVLTASIAMAALLTTAASNKQRALYLFVVLCGLYASYMSGGRGGWIVIPAMLLIYAWLYRDRITAKLAAGVVLVVAALVLIAVVTQPKILVERFNRAVSEVQTFIDDPSQHSSVGNRLNMWRNSVIIWTRNPVFGSGLGDFKYDNDRLVEEGSAYNDKMRYNQAHSIYFDALSSMGAVGLLALLWALLLLPWRLFHGFWKRRRAEGDHEGMFYALGGLSTVVVFAVVGLTEGWTIRNMYVSTYVMCTVSFISSLYIKEKRASSLC